MQTTMAVLHQLIIIDIIIITNKILRPMTCNNDTPNNPYKCNASNNCNNAEKNILVIIVYFLIKFWSSFIVFFFDINSPINNLLH